MRKKLTVMTTKILLLMTTLRHKLMIMTPMPLKKKTQGVVMTQ